jgi:thiaminase
VYLRHAFCKMCFDNGLAKNRIKNYLELDRCTIIHSIKSANMLLDTKDKEFIKTYYNLLNSYADKQKDRDIADGIHVNDNDVLMQSNQEGQGMVVPTTA